MVQTVLVLKAAATHAQDVGAQMTHSRAARLKIGEESLALFWEFGTADGVAWCLHNAGFVAMHRGDLDRAATLFGQALTLFREVAADAGSAACLAGLRAIAERKEAKERKAAWSSTRRADLDTGGAPSRLGDLARLSQLTEREVEVLRLVADGHSNDEIAKSLVIEKRTVESHLTHIGARLCLSRRAVIAQAREILNW